MGLLAAGLLTLLLVVYIFWPERQLLRQPAKTRLDYLEERRESIYDNLRDLRFEYLAGKHPEQDYEAQRINLEDEAAAVLREMDSLQGSSAART